MSVSFSYDVHVSIVSIKKLNKVMFKLKYFSPVKCQYFVRKYITIAVTKTTCSAKRKDI